LRPTAKPWSLFADSSPSYNGAVPQTVEKFTVGLVQMSCSPDPADNLARALERIEEAARLGANIICLPELFRSQYFCQRQDPALFDLAEPVPGPTTEALSKAARRLAVALVAPVFERRAPGVCHNTAAVIDADGRLAGLYRKTHIPDDPLYYEKYYFTPGDAGYPAFDIRYARIGTLICWDQWYPEPARLVALRGAQILFYPTAIGWHPAEKQQHGAVQHEAWKTIQRGHAIANGIYVAAVNRVGHEGPAGAGLEFFGGSFICDPFGVVLAEASKEREEILCAECEPARVEEVRRNWPFLRDRRIDTYGPLTARLLD